MRRSRMWRVPMFGRKNQAALRESAVQARQAQDRARLVIAQVELQALEVEERVAHLELQRTLVDNFGDELLKAMGRKQK